MKRITVLLALVLGIVCVTASMASAKPVNPGAPQSVVGDPTGPYPSQACGYWNAGQEILTTPGTRLYTIWQCNGAGTWNLVGYVYSRTMQRSFGTKQPVPDSVVGDPSTIVGYLNGFYCPTTWTHGAETVYDGYLWYCSWQGWYVLRPV